MFVRATTAALNPSEAQAQTLDRSYTVEGGQCNTLTFAVLRTEYWEQCFLHSCYEWLVDCCFEASSLDFSRRHFVFFGNRNDHTVCGKEGAR